MINALDKELFSPLCCAVRHGHLTIVMLLLDHGANIEVTEDNKTVSALEKATSFNQVEVLRIFWINLTQDLAHYRIIIILTC